MKVGIIGAGTMGAGIAQVFAQTKGYEVVLCDLNRELAEKGKERIVSALKNRVEKGKMSKETADETLKRVTAGIKEDCADCNLVLEAAVESMEIKKRLFGNFRIYAERTVFLLRILLRFPLQRLVRVCPDL